MPLSAPQVDFKVIGEIPLDSSLPPPLRPRVGTIFLRTPGLVTRTTLHATQRLAWIDALNEGRVSMGEAPLTEAETEDEWAHSVDLLFDDERILIRPDPAAMDLAFQADEMLQQRLKISKRTIRFLNIANDQVRAALRGRGEYWRMSHVPRHMDDIMRHIHDARVAIDGPAIYYYNQTTGARLLTFQEFDRLSSLPDNLLRKMLLEIRTYIARRNRQGTPEIDFFLAHGEFGRKDFEKIDFVALDNVAMREAHSALATRFKHAVPSPLQEDNPNDIEWRNQMFAALMNKPHETATGEVVAGLSPEFFLQIEWVPGARIEEGELILDPVFSEVDANPGDLELRSLCDPRAREFIFNYLREFGDIEFVNIGRIGRSLSLRREETRRSTVYIAEVKQSEAPEPVVRIIRFQKWGIMEHLDDGVDLLNAILRAEEYTDYILDRRLACRQLGMRLPQHAQTRRISECYTGSNERYRGQVYWVPYLERDYMSGRASDKLSDASYQNPEFNRRLAHLLGDAAAINMVVGRMRQQNQPGETQMVLFDDGDEVIVLDDQGLPESLVVTDHTGTFVNYEEPLTLDIEAYADPVNRRVSRMPNAAEFADIYLSTFLTRFQHVQETYRARRRAFDSLFKHRPWDPNGSMAYRWFHVLARLDAAHAEELTAAIRAHIRIPSP